MSNEQKKCPNCGGTTVNVYQYAETLLTLDLATGKWTQEEFNSGSNYLSEALCAGCDTNLLHLVPGHRLAEEPMVQQLVAACESLYWIVLDGMTDDYDYMTQELGKARTAIRRARRGRVDEDL